MKSLTILLVPLLFLSSCTIGTNNNQSESTKPNPIQDEYYTNLEKECAQLPSYEKSFCDKSIVIMKQEGYKRAEKIDNKFICPEGMTLDGEKSIGSIWYCKPISK